MLEYNLREKERQLAKDDDFSSQGYSSQYSYSSYQSGLGEIFEEENEYGCEDDSTYYGVCFTFIFLILIGSLYLKDLSLVFGIIAAFSEVILIFILPGLMFL